MPTPIDITAVDGIKSAPQAYQYVDTSISDLCNKMNVDNIILWVKYQFDFIIIMRCKRFGIKVL